jgi:hypothetical protein
MPGRLLLDVIWEPSQEILLGVLVFLPLGLSMGLLGTHHILTAGLLLFLELLESYLESPCLYYILKRFVFL